MLITTRTFVSLLSSDIASNQNLILNKICPIVYRPVYIIMMGSIMCQLMVSGVGHVQGVRRLGVGGEVGQAPMHPA